MDFRFFLKSTRIGSYQIPESEEPIGWDSFKIIMKRHEKFHGIFQEISLKLKFFCGAYDFLKTAYSFDAIDTDVTCYVFYLCEGEEELIYSGIIDFRDIVFTERFAECNLIQTGCIQKFLDRLDVPVNLYDEPCFTELTYDKTAYRTRYKFCPYWISFPEKTIYATSEFVLAGCPVHTSPCSLSQRKSKQIVYNKFQLSGGVGCSLLISHNPPNNYSYCNNTDTIENNAGAKSQFVNPTGQHVYYIINGIQIKKIFDDLEIIEETEPQNSYYQTTLQYHRNCGNNVETLPFPETQWSINKYNNGTIKDCKCLGLPEETIEFKIEIDGDAELLVDIVQGEVEFVVIVPELILQIENEIFVLATYPPLIETPCAWESGQHRKLFCGVPSFFHYRGSIKINSCKILDGAPWGIYARYAIGFKAGGDFLLGSNLSIGVVNYWYEAKGQIVTQNCKVTPLRVGETAHPVYAIHEAFSRIVEHYTNNCLRVKSNLLARPNSMEWSDRCDIQNAAITEWYAYPWPSFPGAPIEVDECGVPLIEKEKEDFYCSPITRTCDCDNPQPFPDCNATFDPAPYRINSILGAGKWFQEGFLVITSGISLRDWGRECFVSFNQLFDAINAVYCIGVGFLPQDSGNIYIERVDFFYNPTVVFSFNNIDFYTAKYAQQPIMQEYITQLEIGYSDWRKEQFNTIDELHTKRIYSVPIRNTQNKKTQICDFIASGYAIEYQRRQRYSLTAEWDNQIFLICVGRSTNPYNTAQIVLPNGQIVSYPSHMWRVEHGVTNAEGILDPLNYYNFRISPYAMANYWCKLLSANIAHKFSFNVSLLEFASGDGNFYAAGQIPFNNDTSILPAVTVGYHTEKDNVIHGFDFVYRFEEVSFNYPLSWSEFKILRMFPYNAVLVNGQKYFIKQIEFSFFKESKIVLLKAE